MIPFRLACAALGWFAVLTQFGLSTIGAPSFAAAAVDYFSFFTLLSNIAVAAAFTAPLLPPGPARAFLLRPGARTAIAVYILVTAIVFYVLLRAIYHPSGLAGLVNVLLHDIMPALYLLDWALFTPRRTLHYAQIPAWLAFPLLFAAWTLAHGAASGWYPYPFLDVTALGLRQVLLNSLVLAAVFAVLSAAFIALNRRLPAGGRLE